MLLEGSIRRFDIASVLQFLAMNSATGVLEVRDFEEYGFVYIVDGRVEGISMPFTDERLGTKLVNAGHITDAQLAHALMEEWSRGRGEKQVKPLGQRLIDMGLADETAVLTVLGRHVRDQVFELAQWRDGVFIYHEPAEMPGFQMKIRGNVQQLLLDAQRRIDEGELARKQCVSVSYCAAQSNPLEAGSVWLGSVEIGPEEADICWDCELKTGCSLEIRSRYLRKDVCLWRTMSAVDDGRREPPRPWYSETADSLSAEDEAFMLEVFVE
jgi:hypothetical protein